jgi:hypothetical protein
MKDKMEIHEDVAEFLYSIVRCGIVHQGMPKIGLRFYNDYKRVDEGKFIYKEIDGYIYLNVVELAYRYLDIVNEIAKQPEQHIRYYPEIKSNDKTKFDNATKQIKDDIGDYLHKKKGPSPGSSLAAYTPEQDLDFDIELPAEE